MNQKTCLIIHNPEHYALLHALYLCGLMPDVIVITPGSTFVSGPLDAVIVVDAPEYKDRSSAALSTKYRDWLDEVVKPRMMPRTRITYLHPAGEPM